jgi:hypothetical protein
MVPSPVPDTLQYVAKWMQGSAWGTVTRVHPESARRLRGLIPYEASF